jgi:hypothetical protein
MKAKSLLVMVAMMALGGCSVVDGDDIEALEQSVSLKVVTPEMRVWAANRFTAGYVLGRVNNCPGCTLGWVECPGFGRKVVEVREMLRCLNTHQDSLYLSCLAALLGDAKDAMVPEGKEGECFWDEYFYGFAPDELPPQCNPDFDGDDVDTARVIVDAVLMGLPDPPPPHIQLLMISGGLFGPAGVICPLDRWGCPGTPWDLPGSTDGSTSGGDR